MSGLAGFIKENPLLAAAFFVFFAAYSNSPGGAFQRDDIPHITDNAFLRGPARVSQLFSQEYFQLNGAVAYRPAVTAVRLVQYRVFGPDPRPWRLLNLLLHAAAAALLCWIFLLVSGSGAAAAAGAALFLLHPAQTEALNYISNGQPDIFCLLFLCVSFLAYLKELRAAAAAAFLLALLSKEMALVFPLFLGGYLLLRGELRARWGFPALLAVVSLAFVLWRLLCFRAPAGFLDSVPAAGAYALSPAGALAAAARFPALAAYYLKLLVWPFPLSAEIDRILPGTWLFSSTGLALSWLTAIVSAALCAAAYGRSKAYVLLPGLFISALLPVSGLVPLTSLAQEHFVYIPSVFFCLAAGLVYAAAGKAGRGRAAAAVLVMILVGSSFAVRSRNYDWRTFLSLAESDARNFPSSSAAQASLAAARKAAGDKAGALQSALAAIAAGPESAEPYMQAAELYLDSGRTADAAGLVRKGLTGDRGPDALVNAARLLARAGLSAEALSLAKEAAAAYPYFEPAFYTLGELLLGTDPCEAEGMFREAVKLNSRSRAAARLAGARPPCRRNI